MFPLPTHGLIVGRVGGDARCYSMGTQRGSSPQPTILAFAPSTPSAHRVRIANGVNPRQNLNNPKNFCTMPARNSRAIRRKTFRDCSDFVEYEG
jgi:hypothetical protein